MVELVSGTERDPVSGRGSIGEDVLLFNRRQSRPLTGTRLRNGNPAEALWAVTITGGSKEC